MIEPRTTEPPALDPIDLDPWLLVATSVLVTSTIAKEILVEPNTRLLFTGCAYLAFCLLASAAAQRSRALGRLILTLGFLCGGINIATSGNATLLIIFPFVPIVAQLEGLRVALVVCFLYTVETVAIGIHFAFPPLAIFQFTASFIGGAVFIFAYATTMVRERAQRQALSRRAAIIEELAVAQERSRLAQEVHDGLGHYLSAALVQLEAARITRQTAPDDSIMAMQRARALVADALRSLRQVVDLLRDDDASTRFEACLEELVDVHRTAGHVTTFEAKGDLRAVAPSVTVAIVHILREALTNVRMHALGQRTTVHLQVESDRTKLTVVDAGQGASMPREGHGLRGMRERVEELGGALHLSRSAHGGFVVEATFPR